MLVQYLVLVTLHLALQLVLSKVIRIVNHDRYINMLIGQLTTLVLTFAYIISEQLYVEVNMAY
jgi:hypothetical protein